MDALGITAYGDCKNLLESASLYFEDPTELIQCLSDELSAEGIDIRKEADMVTVSAPIKSNSNEDLREKPAPTLPTDAIPKSCSPLSPIRFLFT